MENHPLHPAVEMLAQRYGIGFLSKLIWRKHLFDGKNVRLWWYKSSTKQAVPLSDHDVAHEIAHFVVAAPEQRDLPEFGLGYVGIFNQAYCPEVVDYQECEIQEYLAQRVTILWGRRFGFSHVFSNEPDYVSGWDEYESAKLRELNESARTLTRIRIAEEVEKRWALLRGSV